MDDTTKTVEAATKTTQDTVKEVRSVYDISAKSYSRFDLFWNKSSICTCVFLYWKNCNPLDSQTRTKIHAALRC